MTRTRANTVEGDAATQARFADALLAWFDRHGRHDLPWQHPRTPYRVWLSEIMLQQTQVRVVIPYFERFVDALPDVAALARAPLDDVLGLWSGLGYYARARNLHAAAALCVERHRGELPRDLAALQALPGIGRSTAGAILAQAWGDRFPILDGNAKRVLCRVFGIDGWPGAPAVEKRLWSLAETVLPDARLADYTQAQMDFGATLCTRHAPACEHCPLRGDCIALRDGRVHALPVPKPARPVPEREAWMVLVRDADGRVLLQRRPAKGVWPALWSLPEAPDAASARAWAHAHAGRRLGPELVLPPVLHGFTHFRLRMHPLRFDATGEDARTQADADLRWIGPREREGLGIPAPIRTLLESQP